MLRRAVLSVLTEAIREVLDVNHLRIPPSFKIRENAEEILEMLNNSSKTSIIAPVVGLGLGEYGYVPIWWLARVTLKVMHGKVKVWISLMEHPSKTVYKEVEIGDVSNLLEETLETLREIGKSVEDIDWIGTKDGKYVCTWEEFKEMADVEYDAGYGSVEVLPDSVVVFKDGSWLERAEYDGSEWWEYKKKPEKQEQTEKLKRVLVEN